MVSRESNDVSSFLSAASSNTDASSNVHLPENWVEMTTSSGKRYYLNKTTQQYLPSLVHELCRFLLLFLGLPGSSLTELSPTT